MRSLLFKNFLLMLCLMFCGSKTALSLTVEVFEKDSSALGLRVAKPLSARDADVLKKIERMPFMVPVASNEFIVNLDSTPGIAEYLRAARLGGGVYIYFPLLCPDSDCSGIDFELKAKQILIGGDRFSSSVLIRGGDTANSAAFLLNESNPNLERNPNLNQAIYIDSGFSREAAKRINDSLAAILSAYHALIGEDPIRDRAVVVTLASDTEGAPGYGGDALNIIRLTYHNRRAEPEVFIVDMLIKIFAHEIAHSLHSSKLQSMASHGRVISEGSADFLHVIVLRRAGLIDPQHVKVMVDHAYNECQAKRDNHGLKERIEMRTNHFKELYNCGMVYYFAKMFGSATRDGNDPEVSIARRFAMDFRAAPNVADEEAACLLMLDECTDPRLKAILGDAQALKAQRGWFDQKMGAYVGAMSPIKAFGVPKLRDVIARRP